MTRCAIRFVSAASAILAGSVGLGTLAGCVPAEPAFVAPETCTELLGATLEQEFLDAGEQLFDDSNGNGINPGTGPIGQDGGDPVYCLYGRDQVDLSTFELSAQPVTQEEHEGILAELQSRGYDESTDGPRVTFAQEGFEGNGADDEIAVVHFLYSDGWITAYSTFGGANRLTQLRFWAESVVEQVYPG